MMYTKGVVSMRKKYFLFTVLVVFCLVSISNIYAIKPGDCKYLKDDKTKVDDNGYIMSWLILDPYINDGVDSAQSCNKDYFEDKGGEANIKPKEGDEVKIKETNSEHVWARLNFQDLKDMAQIPTAVGGNELDISCWGGQGPTNTQEYMVTYLKWNKDTTATFNVGVDDATEVFFNGELIISDPSASQNWGDGNAGIKEVKANGGVWNILVVGCYESSGEWGISVQVDPVPDEVDNKGPAILFAVEPVDKMSITWGRIKTSY
jgi:hypothetical protein